MKNKSQKIKQKEYKPRPLQEVEEKEEKMGLFGRGNGFLGLSKGYNTIVTVVATILALIGIAYFVFIRQALLAMAILAIWIIIMIETHREK